MKFEILNIELQTNKEIFMLKQTMSFCSGHIIEKVEHEKSFITSGPEVIKHFHAQLN